MTTIAVVVVLLLVLLVLALGLWLVRRQRSRRLQERFGPEYDRVLQRTGSRREAEQALTEVAERREQLTLHSLTPGQRQHWAGAWSRLQAQFVDTPAEAVSAARDLIPGLLRERGYPAEDFEDRAVLLATDHPGVVGKYRAAEHAYQRHLAAGGSSTEALRQALVHYRALFDALIGDEHPGAEHPGAAEPTGAEPAGQPGPAEQTRAKLARHQRGAIR